MDKFLKQCIHHDQMSDLIGQIIFWLKRTGWPAALLLAFIVTASILILWKSDKERMLYRKKGYHLIWSANMWRFIMVWMIYGAMEDLNILCSPDIYEKSIIFLPLEIILLAVGIWKTAGESFWLAIPISVLRFAIIGFPLYIISIVTGYLALFVLGGMILLIGLVLIVLTIL